MRKKASLCDHVLTLHELNSLSLSFDTLTTLLDESANPLSISTELNTDIEQLSETRNKGVHTAHKQAVATTHREEEEKGRSETPQDREKALFESIFPSR